MDTIVIGNIVNVGYISSICYEELSFALLTLLLFLLHLFFLFLLSDLNVIRYYEEAEISAKMLLTRWILISVFYLSL